MSSLAKQSHWYNRKDLWWGESAAQRCFHKGVRAQFAAVVDRSVSVVPLAPDYQESQTGCIRVPPDNLQKCRSDLPNEKSFRALQFFPAARHWRLPVRFHQDASGLK